MGGREIFTIPARAPGYSASKNLPDGEGRLEGWYRFEEDAETRALREWCEANSMRLMTD